MLAVAALWWTHVNLLAHSLQPKYTNAIPPNEFETVLKQSEDDFHAL
jgi:hypothetical protein